MTIAEATILGVLQGFTEFLPVSSSGHLKVAEQFLHVKGGGTYFDVLLHVATLLAVLIYLRRDVLEVLYGLAWPWVSRDSKRGPDALKGLKILGYMFLASIPAGIVGVLVGSRLESLANSPSFVGANLIFNGFILLSIPFAKASRRRLGPGTALIVGTAQVLGILRGISRSGVTITSGLHAGLDPREAGRFSFLIFIPAVLGAFLLELLKANGGVALIPGLVGFIAAFISGLIAIKLVFKMLSAGKLYWFGPYCLVVGLFLVLFHGV